MSALWSAAVVCAGLAAVDVVWASAIAVLGTLLGSFGTLLLQRRDSAQATTAAREESRRQERLSACLTYAEAAAEQRRATADIWLRLHDTRRDEEVVRAAHREGDKRGAAVKLAALKVQLLTNDPQLRLLAVRVASLVDAFDRAASLADLKSIEADWETALDAFIAAAHRQVT